MFRYLLIPGVILILSGLGAATLMATAPQIQPNSPEAAPMAVRVQAVAPTQLNLTVHSQGTVEPQTVTQLIPEVSGRVVWISPSFVAGGRFTKGEALIRLDNRDYDAALKRARATLTRASAEFEHARFEHRRLEQLAQDRLASRSQLESALRTRRVAEASLQDAKLAVEQASRDLSRTQISAPFNGLVRSESADVGQFVGRGNEIASIYAEDFVEVRLPLADEQLAYLDIPLRGEIPQEQAPEVTLRTKFAGRQFSWTGQIHRVEAEIDLKSRMVHVVARVPSDPDGEFPLSVGMFVDADIHGRTVEDVVVLPRNALRNNNQVLIVDANNQLQFRNVTPLRLYRDEVILREGLQLGDRVCLSPVQSPVAGTPVQPTMIGLAESGSSTAAPTAG